MVNSYDCIISGLGGMGSATAYHLSKRGYRVLGLDAYPRGHTNGSSHGRSRIIRQAYAESPDYVPLVLRAYTLWRELEAESGQNLLTITGGLLIGEPTSETVAGALKSAQMYQLEVESLSPAEVGARFPGFRLPENLVAVLEPAAGILEPEACVSTHLDLAARRGADLHFAEPVRQWEKDGSGIAITTDLGSYRADRLVVTAGPWAGELLADLQLPLTVQRVINVHFEPAQPALFALERCPIYIWEVPEGTYYGFPLRPGEGIKFGRHDAGEQCTPQTIRREVGAGEIEALRRIVERYMPGAAGPVKWTLTCMYTTTPDHHFILDRHPHHTEVVYGCGFSGHGFKFSSVIGEILADLATEGVTRHAVSFLSAARFGLA